MPPPWDDFGGRTPQDRGRHPLPLSQLVLFNRRQTGLHPHVGGPGQNTHPDVDRSTLGLTEIRSHIWRDVVWVNVDGQAPEFEVAMKP